MTHPHDSVRVLPVGVDELGVVEVFGLRYWSEESAKFGRRLAEIRVSPFPHSKALLLSLKGKKLCEVQLMDNCGFLDPVGARQVAARLRHKIEALRVLEQEQGHMTGAEPSEPSVVRGNAEVLLDLIDDSVEHARINRQSFGHIVAKPLLGFLHNIMRRAGITSFENAHDADADSVERREARLEKAQSLLEHLQLLVGGHGDNSRLRRSEKRNQADASTHCLSEVAK